MFRRCVCILVLLGFIAGQLAVVPHAHGGYSPEEQRQHDARPHVHVGFCGHSHEHNHSHDGHSHSHPTDKAAPASVEQLSNGGCGPCVEHDADAIYLPCGASSPATVKDQRTASSAELIHSADTASCATCLLPNPRNASAPIHPPNGHSSGAKLFLTLRNLRI
jgi:hypothetical protein